MYDFVEYSCVSVTLQMNLTLVALLFIESHCQIGIRCVCVHRAKVNTKICLPTFGVICKHQRECQRKHVHESKGSRVALRIRAEIFYVCSMPNGFQLPDRLSRAHSLSLSLSLSHSLCLSVLYYATSCSWAAGVGGNLRLVNEGSRLTAIA